MIKKLFLLLIITCLAFNVSCKKNNKYDSKITQLRSDILKYECEDFTLTTYVEIIETPILNDGKIGKTENLLTFKLKNKKPNENLENCSLSFTLNGQNYTASFEFKQIPTLLNCHVTVSELPTNTLDVSLTINGKSQAITLNSVKNKCTKSHNEVLKALENEQDFSSKTTENIELRIRLINNDGYDYWYVGVIDNQSIISYLVDGETLETIAKKQD